MKLSHFFIVILFLNARLIACEEEEEDEPVAVQDENLSTDDNSSEQKLSPVLTDIDEAEFSKLRQTSEKHVYQAEVGRMMDIIVNSLYRNKEIFLRELVSNSFDAIDKVRFYSLKNPSVLDSNPDFDIRIKADPVNKVLTITDTGIGMTRDDLINNLGTIAKSGTKDFISKLGEMSEDKNTPGDLSSQIGQFGVGFYSVFLVANRIMVISKHNEDPKQWVLEADQNSFEVYEDPRGDTLKRGTSVILYLNDDATEFLEERRIANIIRKYSEFIQFPIYLFSKLDQDGKEVPYYWKHINDMSPLWMRSPSEISEQEYTDFYNVVTYGRKKEKYSKPSGIIHFNAEGETNFRALIFLTDKLDDEYVNAPLLWKMKLKLYVRRVMISSETQTFLPHYLRHVTGVIDSEDLPLNVGRESLQHNELVKVISKKLVRKILDHLKKMAQENVTKYNTFYLEFGNAIKFGILDDEPNSNRIAKLLRFYSSYSPDNLTSFDEYVSRMKPGQSVIYYVTAASVDDAKKSPYLEKIRHYGYEVLFMTDNIDESVIRNLRNFEGKNIQHVAKEDLITPSSKTEEETLKEKEAEYKGVLKWLKKSFYKGKIGYVKLSKRLLTSSCILVASEDGYSGNLERIVRSQAYVHGKESGFDEVLNQPKNLELNPYHPLVKTMLSYYADKGPDSEELRETADICLNVATLAGGYHIEDGVGLSKLLEKVFMKSHDIPYKNVEKNIYEELGMEEEAKNVEEEQKISESQQDQDVSDEDDDEEPQPKRKETSDPALTFTAADLNEDDDDEKETVKDQKEEL